MDQCRHLFVPELQMYISGMIAAASFHFEQSPVVTRVAITEAEWDHVWHAVLWSEPGATGKYLPEMSFKV